MSVTTPPASITLSKAERRKAQNRRAQANLRKKRQEHIQNLQQQIGWLEAQNSTRIPLAQDVDYPQLHGASGEFCSDPQIGHSYLSIQDANLGDVVPGSLPLPDLSLNYTPPGSFPESVAPPRQYPSNIPSQPILQRVPPRANQLCTFDSLTSNADLLDISPECFLSTDSDSPFYKPFRAAAICDRHIPCSLRPTAAQLSYPHQPWIDCIALSEFRSRVVFAVSHQPPLLCTLTLWHDVLSEGLYCIGHPEDSAAWKMSDDFSKKWQMLLTINLNTLATMCLASNPPLVPVDMCDM